MNNDSKMINPGSGASHGTFVSYASGFILSVGLTLIAYASAVRHLLAGRAIIIALVTLAVVQLFVQLLFFLHMGRESKPRWNLMVFGFMLLFLLIIVIGSLWIMHNLDYRMTPTQMNKYMQDQADGGL